MSSIASLVLSPFNWLLVLIIIALASKKRSLKRRCFFFAALVFIIFGNKLLINYYAKKWQPVPVDANALHQYSCGVVPGGFASPDAAGNGYFNATSDRFIEALKLFKMHKISHILISGGNGKDDDKSFREAAWVKNELLEMEVPDSVIFTEDQSDNTADNAVNAKRLLDSLHFPPPYILITSAMHVPRALLLFKKAGLITDAFPCNYTEGRDIFSWTDLLPRLSVLSDWNGYMKEAAGFAWYSIKK